MKRIKIIHIFILLLLSVGTYAQTENAFNVEQGVAETVAMGAFMYHYEDIGATSITKTETYRVDNDDLFYIISFEKKGFAIVAADYRVTPLLAISNEETFSIESLTVESDSLKEGLALWVDIMVEQIRMTQEYERPSMYANTVGLWVKYFQRGKEFKEFPIKSSCNPGSKNFPSCNGTVVLGKKIYEGPEPPGPYVDPCPDKIIIANIGPLLQTSWTQVCNFNSTMPNLPNKCDKNLFCGKRKVGCFATAAAQISKFNNSPSSINGIVIPYGQMPNNQSSQLAASMMDVYGQLGARVFVNCHNTGVSGLGGKAALAAVGYKYDGYDELDIKTVKTDMQNGRPILALGFSSTPILLNVPSAHFWVIDGYKEIKCEPKAVTELNITRFIHMNWGQGVGNQGGQGNGWYYFHDKDNSFQESNGVPNPPYDDTYRAFRILHNIH